MENAEHEQLRSVALRNAQQILQARRRAEDALRKQTEWLRVTLSSIGDGVISTDAEGRISFMNRVAESLTGWQESDALDRPLEDVFRVIDEQSRASVENPAMRALRAEKVVELTNPALLIAKDGTERPLEDSAAPIRAANGTITGAVLVFRDVTDRKKADDELRTSELRLRQLASDLSVADRRKNEFLAMLAHELRNPLAPIRNALSVIRLTSGKGSAVDEASAMMERQVAQLSRLVDDLLDINRITRGKVELRRERVDLASVVHHAVEACRPLSDSMRHEFSVVLPPGPIHVNGDPMRLSQVVGNLLNNACKYTQKEGCISLTVERDATSVAIRVRDNGIGIAADQLPVIFEMFTQLDTSPESSQSGLGIGLTLVKELVEMHGGEVEAHSSGVGHGSEFTIRLPLSTQLSSESAPELPAPEPLAANGRRILIADDTRDSATSLAMLMELASNETRTVFDGLEAVQAAALFRPDVVFLDIGMPKLDGYEAARRIREQPWGKNMFLVALTGWGQDEDRQKSKDAGFDAHLVKPIDHAELVDLLADLQLVRPS
ncbi:MAG: ATP-binding protein [Burkholderiaceae bacterium]